MSKKNALNRPHGFACETQGTLFFEVERILRHHRPKVFLLENVKNLVNHDRGNTFRTIHHVLANDLGYHVQWKIIDAKSWVPQHRERIFIIGFGGPFSPAAEEVAGHVAAIDLVLDGEAGGFEQPAVEFVGAGTIQWLELVARRLPIVCPRRSARQRRQATIGIAPH